MRNLTDIDALAMDIARTIGQYPKLRKSTNWHLRLDRSYSLPFLEGWLDIRDPNGQSVDAVQVQLCFTRQFPYCYPKVYEIGGRFAIDKWDILHVNSNGTLCLDVPQHEIIHTCHGLATNDFISSVLIPNLAWRVHKLDWPNEELQEHRHGLEGLLDEYKLMFNSSSKQVVIQGIELFMANRLLEPDSLCFCGSGKIYRLCHSSAIESLRPLPINLLQSHLIALKRNPDSL